MKSLFHRSISFFFNIILNLIFIFRFSLIHLNRISGLVIYFAVHLLTTLRSSGGETGLVRKSLHPASKASALSLS